MELVTTANSPTPQKTDVSITETYVDMLIYNIHTFFME